MKLNEKYIRWTARAIAVFCIVFGLPFYFGYGNPLPFINPDYTFFDNLWLSCFPVIFIGLAVGLKYEKIGGYLVTVPIVLATLIGFIVLREGLPGPMFVPLIVGFLYLILGYKKWITKD